ncbi:hypothetical protein ACHWQZ_G018199 [Mnemiopsis leidyi]
MSSSWIGGGNIQILSNGVQNIKSEGYVTKKYFGYGCIDKNTMFNFGVVQGPLPNIGDKVSYEAQRTTAAQCWNATKVKVVQFQQSTVKKQESSTGTQGNYMYPPSYNQTAKSGNPRFSSFPSQQAGSQQPAQNQTSVPQSTQQAGYTQQIRGVSKFSQEPVKTTRFTVANPPPMAHIIAQPTSNFTAAGKGNKRSRFDTGPPTAPQNLDHKGRVLPVFPDGRNDRKVPIKVRRSRSPPRKRSYSRSRSRSRSPHRSRSPRKSRSPRRSPRRSRSPRRKRSPRTRYSVKFAKFNLLRPSMDILFMQTHYPTLYVPSDVSHVFRHAVMKSGETIPYTNIIRYNVTSASQTPATSVGSKAYRSKVLLMRSVSKTKLYHTILNDKKEHFLKLLSFWCNYNDKEITAFGGTWSAEHDGADPENNPQTLINTAIRNVKSQLGLDLSYCKTWYKICEVHYHRVNDKRNTEEHVEKTVMYLPSIWDCQPSQEDWDILKRPVYKTPAPAEEKEETEESEESNIDNELTPATQIEIDFEGDDIDIASEGTEEVTVMTGVPPDKPVGEGTAGLTETDIKAMKVTELRNELDRRGLSTKGLKIQLIARLQKAIKDETEGCVGVSSDPQVGGDSSTAAQHWKLQPEVQKKMNILISRLGIVEKDIPELPDLASVVLHPAKGVEVQDYTLSSLLDYNKSDKKERVFEVSLFAEVLSEMFQRHFALLILRALIEADGESEEQEEEKTVAKRQRNDTESSDGGRKDSESDKTESSAETRSEKYVHRPDLLLAFLFFDRYRAGYLAEDDILAIVHSIGLNISRSQIKLIIDKVLMGKSKLNYRGLCEKVSTGGPNVIQQETVKLKEIEEVLLLGTQASNNVVKVDVTDAPLTERSGSIESVPTKPHDENDVVVVGGSYVVRSELPELLSKAMKKVTGLESKVRDLERQNEKLEKRIEESKSVKHNYVDLEEEVIKRKNELDILSEEKTRSELSARKYRALLDSTKSALHELVGQISGGLDEGADKRTEEKGKIG